jgi:hypothetical protein
VLPLSIEKQHQIIAFTPASPGSCEIADFWNITANPTIGENKNEPVSVKITMILYFIMI